jgi:hypothetical protein
MSYRTSYRTELRSKSSGRVMSIRVITPNHGEKYLRTYADGLWTDNLLALPRR